MLTKIQALIADVEQPFAYDIVPVLWSKRDEVRQELAA